MVVGPDAGHRDRDLVVAGALERPVIVVRHLLDHIHRMDFAGEFEFEQFHGMLPVVLERHTRSGEREAHMTNKHLASLQASERCRTARTPASGP